MAYCLEDITNRAERLHHTLSEGQRIPPITLIKARLKQLNDALPILEETLLDITTVKARNAALGIARHFDTTSNQLQRSAYDTLKCIQNYQPVPELQDIIDDILAIKLHYNTVRLLSSGALSAVTENIQCRGYPTDFGPFKITINLRYPHDPASDIIRVTALEPHPNADTEYPHPHVEGNYLCMSDSQQMIHKAIKTGRILDAFDMIQNCLRSYNPDSPYRSMSHYMSEACPCCNERYDPDSDDASHCECCDNTVCHYCQIFCRHCNYSTCLDCNSNNNEIDRCSNCRASVCRNCSNNANDGYRYCKKCASVLPTRRTDATIHPVYQS